MSGSSYPFVRFSQIGHWTKNASLLCQGKRDCCPIRYSRGWAPQSQGRKVSVIPSSVAAPSFRHTGAGLRFKATPVRAAMQRGKRGAHSLAGNGPVSFPPLLPRCRPQGSCQCFRERLNLWFRPVAEQLFHGVPNGDAVFPLTGHSVGKVFAAAYRACRHRTGVPAAGFQHGEHPQHIRVFRRHTLGVERNLGHIRSYSRSAMRRKTSVPRSSASGPLRPARYRSSVPKESNSREMQP